MEEQIGLEETPQEFIDRLVEVFREVKRVLREDGTLWVNIGDSYCAGSRSSQRPQSFHFDEAHDLPLSRRNKASGDLKDKDLVGIPWMLAFAMRKDGWWLRQDIIWSKPNCMPESVKDRCTKSHEYIFLFSKSKSYFFDHEAIRTPTSNRRSVWQVSPRPYPEAHFAVFPPELIDFCVLAGCPAGGTVLDPFAGSGTTAGVALLRGRRAILCELNEDFARLIPSRIESISGRSKEQRTMQEWIE